MPAALRFTFDPKCVAEGSGFLSMDARKALRRAQTRARQTLSCAYAHMRTQGTHHERPADGAHVAQQAVNAEETAARGAARRKVTAHGHDLHVRTVTCQDPLAPL